MIVAEERQRHNHLICLACTICNFITVEGLTIQGPVLAASFLEMAIFVLRCSFENVSRQVFRFV